MLSVYILHFTCDKYYIGSTFDLIKRLNQHFQQINSSEWTKKFYPIDICEIIENADAFDEDKYTKIYMKKYGIENVRGGSYSQLVLSKEQIRTYKFNS